ncbi:rhomboid family intramembrane serine protease [Allorhizobium pseudoryzae]|uniref:rhomboid family intramembrane serine protease n=1 Tax=Allorhizobium pseudoryzae TaxID=379684 RepID=UPI003D063D15
MFIPLYDVNHLKHIRAQYVTIGLIVVNFLVWAFGTVAPAGVADLAALTLGFIPAVAFEHAVLPPALDILPGELSFVTYAFVHFDFWHLASNMVFLWVFGDNVEDALGHLRFLLFYLACAAAGALFHGLINPLSEAPLIGASGAVSGIVVAYLILHPRVRLWTLVFFRIPLPLPAFIPLLLWVGQQFVMLVLDLEGMVSWGAHVGGILAGAVLVVAMRRPGVPLFDRRVIVPRAVELKDPS